MSDCTCADPTAVVQAINQHEQNLIKSDEKLLSDDGTTFHQSFFGKGMGNESGESGGGGGCGKSGEPGAPAPIRFCHWQAPEYGNQGESAWTTLFRAAALAIAIANGLAQQEIADKQQDLADSWYQQAKYKWNRYKDTYIPLEKQLLNEVSTAPVPELDCDGAETRARTAVNTAYDSVNAHLTRYAKSMRLCIDSSLLGYPSNRRYVALADSINYNYVDDRWYRDYKDDQRWNRRSNVLNLGRNLDSQSLAYGQVANALYGQVGQQIDRAANMAITALGYFGARNDTYYPTTYLGSGGGVNSQLVGINTPSSINPTGISSAGVG